MTSILSQQINEALGIVQTTYQGRIKSNSSFDPVVAPYYSIIDLASIGRRIGLEELGNYDSNIELVVPLLSKLNGERVEISEIVEKSFEDYSLLESGVGVPHNIAEIGSLTIVGEYRHNPSGILLIPGP